MNRSAERGAALVITLLALTLVAALVGALCYLATDEYQQAGQARRSQRALGVAELGLAGLLDSLSGTTSRAVSGVSDRQVHRLSDQLYLLDATAHDGPSRRRLGLLARLRAPRLLLSATLTTRGDVSLRDGAAIDGADHAAAGWGDSCPPAGAGVPALGDVTDPLAGVDYGDLAARAGVQLSPGSYAPQPALTWDGACDTLVASNWGDGVASAGACGGTVRAVHVAGNVEIVGGRGAGLLLVDGDLTIAGPFEYQGLIVVQGRLETRSWSDGRAAIDGGLLVANPSAASQQVAGNVQMSYSNCSIINALRLMARPTPLRSRAWIQLF